MKYFVLFMLMSLASICHADGIDLSESDLFVPIDQSDEFDYPTELEIGIRTGGGIDTAAGVCIGQYILAMDFSAIKGIDADKKIRYFDVAFTIEETGNEIVGQHGNIGIKVIPLALSFQDVFGMSINGMVEVGVLPFEVSRNHHLDEQSMVKFYLLSLKSQQIVPLNDMTLIFREAIKGIGHKYVTYAEESGSYFAPLEGELEIELQINNLMKLIGGASLSLVDINGQVGVDHKYYVLLELGVDLGSTAINLFLESGYQIYHEQTTGHFYLTLGISLHNIFAFTPKNKKNKD